MNNTSQQKKQTELSSILASLDFLILETTKSQNLEVTAELQQARNNIAGQRNLDITPDENFVSLFNAFKSMIVYLLLGTQNEKKKCINLLKNINNDFLKDYQMRQYNV